MGVDIVWVTFFRDGAHRRHGFVPVALFYQRFPLLLAGVLLPFIRLVQDLL